MSRASSPDTEITLSGSPNAFAAVSKGVVFCFVPSCSRVNFLFEKHDFNAFPVVEDGRLYGIISKFDFLRAFAFTTSQVVPHYNELMSRSATEVMNEAVVHVDPTSPLTRVLQLMVGLKTRSFPVMGAGGRLEGMISREDVMRALKETTSEKLMSALLPKADIG
jgi:CBS-domain-containing membrane protein